ncbi:MAG: hypothetical protein H6581_20870 [Bacteroidia bacterium]|nr:hypothetical protein [Bacteroidia bacterium]
MNNFRLHLLEAKGQYVNGNIAEFFNVLNSYFLKNHGTVFFDNYSDPIIPDQNQTISQYVWKLLKEGVNIKIPLRVLFGEWMNADPSQYWLYWLYVGDLDEYLLSFDPNDEGDLNRKGILATILTLIQKGEIVTDDENHFWLNRPILNLSEFSESPAAFYGIDDDLREMVPKTLKERSGNFLEILAEESPEDYVYWYLKYEYLDPILENRIKKFRWDMVQKMYPEFLNNLIIALYNFKELSSNQRKSSFIQPFAPKITKPDIWIEKEISNLKKLL